MNTSVLQQSLLADLEARQDELILRLNDLDKQVERALADCQAYRGKPAASECSGGNC